MTFGLLRTLKITFKKLNSGVFSWNNVSVPLDNLWKRLFAEGLFIRHKVFPV